MLGIFFVERGVMIGVCIVLLCTVVWMYGFVIYTFFVPDLRRRWPWMRPLSRVGGKLLFGVASVLSLLRAPLGLLPYLVKLFLIFGLRIRYEAHRTTYARELLNLLGDVANLALSWWLIAWLITPFGPSGLLLLCYLPVWAELVRLLAERLPSVFSAVWQMMPHRRMAQGLIDRQRSGLFWYLIFRSLALYCAYYALDDFERAEAVLRALKCRAGDDVEVSKRLEYIRAFRIVPQKQGLRGGMVRDVARGEVFIHGIWTADPWLLIGMALRRAPWSFDPRYLRRPFYYMSEANRVTSLFVLEQMYYSPPFALFQFGHEIRVARLSIFYGVLRWLGADIERKVWADGTFQTDQMIFWLRQRFSRSPQIEPRPLSTDEEVLSDMTAAMMEGRALPTAQMLAARYVYPVKYIEEVLLPHIQQIQEEGRNDGDTVVSLTGNA